MADDTRMKQDPTDPTMGDDTTNYGDTDRDDDASMREDIDTDRADEAA
jgi:hypothetical protein